MRGGQRFATIIGRQYLRIIYNTIIIRIISSSLRNERLWLATEACHSLLTLHCCTPPFHQAITEQRNSYPDNQNITEKKRDG